MSNRANSSSVRSGRSNRKASQERAVPAGGDKPIRLGAVLRRHREERDISGARLAKETGLSRAYLSYLETGKFGDVGLDKFSRVVSVLDLSADQVLREAGYLPGGAGELLEPRAYLATRFDLSPANLDIALAFLEFLADRETTETAVTGRGRRRT